MPLQILKSQDVTKYDDVQFVSVTAQLDANNEIISNVGVPIEPSDGARNDQITNLQNDKLSIDGTSTMTGNLNIGNNFIVNTNTLLFESEKIQIGSSSESGIKGVSIGQLAGDRTGARQGIISIGYGAGCNVSDNSVCIGRESADASTYSDANQVLIGFKAGRSGRSANSVCIGANTYGKGANSVVIGSGSYNPTSTFANNVLLGAGAVGTELNQIIIKADTNVIKADSTGLTYNSNNVEGDFKADGTVPMNGVLDMGTNAITSNSLLNSTSTSTGSINTTGGVGIAQDVYIGGDMYMNKPLCETYTHNNVLVTPIAIINTWYVISADNLTANGNNLEFTTTNTLNKPRMTYTGTRTILFHCGCTFALNPVTSADTTWEIGLSKNGVDVTSSHVLLNTITNGHSYSSALHSFIKLDSNDYVEVIVKNTDNTNNIVINNMNFFAVSLSTINPV